MILDVKKTIQLCMHLFYLSLVVLVITGCPRPPEDDDPGPPDPPDPPTDTSVDRGLMPVIEFQVNNTNFSSDDYIGTDAVPCRLRIVNQLDFVTDVQVSLENVDGDNRQVVFSYTPNASQSGFLTLMLPANGDWAQVYLRPFQGIQSSRDKEAVVQMTLVRSNPAGGPRPGTVVGRKAMMVTNNPPSFSNTRVELEINNTASTADDYVTWSPTPCRIRLLNGSSNQTVNLRNMAGSTGRVLFALAGTLTPHNSTATSPALNNLNLPGNGDWVNFYIAGQFGSPSISDKDAIIEVTDNTGNRLDRTALMVRIRKDANNLTSGERDRFLDALTTLNQSMDMYSMFNDIHSVAIQEAHFGPAFLPWHRVFLLDLERLLQIIDPSVAIPYWQFDEPAPNVFDPDFMGRPSGGTTPIFTVGNPLALWRVDGLTGIVRQPEFGQNEAPPGVISEFATLAFTTQYQLFNSTVETGPHARAHGASGGWMAAIPTAVRDPLFFLLHTNVDRLWAKWQWVEGRLDPESISSFSPQGSFPSEALAVAHIGHYQQDRMWPWNLVTGSGSTALSDRPTSIPGGQLEVAYGFEAAPPASPAIYDMIDYQSIRSNTGVAQLNRGMGFAYDDTPFQ